MKKQLSRVISGLSLAAFGLQLAVAQPAVPRIGYVHPAGGRQGATFQVTIGGQFLDGVTNAFVSGTGVQADVVDFNKPMPIGQFNNLREQIRELQDRKTAARRSPGSTNVWTAADEMKITEIRGKILKNPPNRQGNPAIAETVTLRVSMAMHVEPGEHEIRLGTPAGLSNPLVFFVNNLPEFSHPAAKAANPEADRVRERFGKSPDKNSANPETRISLPVIVNGQIMPGRADRFRFSARKGQQLVAAVNARSLIPYLADAVPGWFQATLALYDTKGKELAYDDDFRFHPDPVLHFTIPKDGDYVIEIKDAIYRGREDFVYRITVGELPFVTCLFPLGGKAGETTALELKGWNLPVPRTTRNNPSPGLNSLTVSRNEHLSNPMPFAVDTLSEVSDLEPNNEPNTAQRLSPPVIVNGRIGQPCDTDVFCFDGRAGDEFVVEVQARRLNSPLDSWLKLTDASGGQCAFNDDREDRGAGLNTHHADSYFHVTLPASGPFFIHLGDTQHKGGEDFAYRLRFSPPRPDFELRVVPSSITVRAGVCAPMTMYVLRRDGFTNEITLSLTDPPDGFALSGGRVPANQDQVRFTLSAPVIPQTTPVTISLDGRSVLEGRHIVRPAIPADDMMQAFAYRHLVPARELKVAVTGRELFRSPLKILGSLPVKIPVGTTARVRLNAPARALIDRVQFDLSEPPDGLSIRGVSPLRDGAEIELACDASKLKPGLKGNLIVVAYAARKPEAGKPKGPANNRRVPVGALPAIPFEIVAAE
jgi:hypothetical protein